MAGLYFFAQKKNMSKKIIIKLDLEKDAWNWWNGCNKISHGVDWKTKINSNLRKEIVGKTQKDAYSFLIPYLENIYKNLNIDSYINDIQKGFSKNQSKIFERMHKVTNRPIYRDTFICFLTSFPRFPYNYEKGYIWISNKRPLDFQISVFIHELLHFQYFAYFGEKVWDELGPDMHEGIKEAMTIILNEEFKDITPVSHEGYEIYRDLSKKLLEIWGKTENMDKFIEKTIKELK